MGFAIFIIILIKVVLIEFFKINITLKKLTNHFEGETLWDFFMLITNSLTELVNTRSFIEAGYFDDDNCMKTLSRS